MTAVESAMTDAYRKILEIPKKGPVVAIDGPAGTGKSSATRRLAEALGFVHIDTGALYRSIAYLLVRDKADKGEELGDTIDEARATEIAQTAKLSFQRAPKKNPSNRVIADGKDITTEIRTPEVSMLASKVSAVPGVRMALLTLQRTMGGEGKAILEGRDIGTMIFPDADVKFFLTASIEERAKRRLAEIEASGSDAPSYEELKQQIAARDHGDMSRAIAPLKQAADAVVLDTSSLTLDQVVEWMEKKVRATLKA